MGSREAEHDKPAYFMFLYTMQAAATEDTAIIVFPGHSNHVCCVWAHTANDVFLLERVIKPDLRIHLAITVESIGKGCWNIWKHWNTQATGISCFGSPT